MTGATELTSVLLGRLNSVGDIISVEPSEIEVGEDCACCGKSSVSVSGYINSSENGTLAAYVVHWTSAHITDEGAVFDIILGQWGKDSSSENRAAASLSYSLQETGPTFVVINSSTRPVGQSELVCRALDRKDIIGKQIAKRVLFFCDLILSADQRLTELLGDWKVNPPVV